MPCGRQRDQLLFASSCTLPSQKFRKNFCLSLAPTHPFAASAESASVWAICKRRLASCGASAQDRPAWRTLRCILKPCQTWSKMEVSSYATRAALMASLFLIVEAGAPFAYLLPLSLLFFMSHHPGHAIQAKVSQQLWGDTGSARAKAFQLSPLPGQPIRSARALAFTTALLPVGRPRVLRLTCNDCSAFGSDVSTSTVLRLSL